MITTKQQLISVLKQEKQIYYSYMFPTTLRQVMGWIKSEPIYKIWKWQKSSRYSDYYHYKAKHNGTLLEKLLYLWFVRQRNRMALKLGIEINTENINTGFLLYHPGGTVINGNAIIGKNCHLHGNNCIGNAGADRLDCPSIGDNVMIGVGAKVIGGIKIANNIKIAAGAIVVTSFTEEGITIGGIPANKLK